MDLSVNTSLTSLNEELQSEQKILSEAVRSGSAFDTIREIQLRITQLEDRIAELTRGGKH